MYEIKILDFVESEPYCGPGRKAKQEFTNKTLHDHKQRHFIKIGWTANMYQKNLGYDNLSVAYDNFADKHHGSHKKPYGEPFTKGDVIRTCIEFN